MCKTDKNNSLAAQFDLTITNEANRGTVLATAIEVFTVAMMYSQTTDRGTTLVLIIEGEVPYIDDNGYVGATNQLKVSGSLNDFAATCGAYGDDVLSFEVNDFIMAKHAVEEINVKVIQSLEVRYNEKRLKTMFAFVGANASEFGKQLMRVRKERLSEASEHADLYKMKQTTRSIRF